MFKYYIALFYRYIRKNESHYFSLKIVDKYIFKRIILKLFAILNVLCIFAANNHHHYEGHNW
jgi:hypothetical protein